ncbi:hypothetical protein VZT92_026097 [Zoarces viviparus]|uniref:Uncharacterized protein n=1 Tax=Zoarces viviparus TaxID=48416 RepID=A0AAW1DZD3_ZOAVI
MEPQGCEGTRGPRETESSGERGGTGVITDPAQTALCKEDQLMTKSAVGHFLLGQGLQAHGHFDSSPTSLPSSIVIHEPNNAPFLSLERQWAIPGKRYHRLSTIGQAYS